MQTFNCLLLIHNHYLRLEIEANAKYLISCLYFGNFSQALEGVSRAPENICRAQHEPEFTALRNPSQDMLAQAINVNKQM